MITKDPKKAACPENLEFLKDSAAVKELMDKKYTNNTRRNYYNSFIVALKITDAKSYEELIDEYNTFRDIDHNIYQEKLKNNEMSDKQKKNWITMNQVDKVIETLEDYKDLAFLKYNKRNTISNRDMQDIQNFLLLSLYKHIPMRNDFGNMEIVTPSIYKKISQKLKKDFNYLVMPPSAKDAKFYFNNYKTSRLYGTKIRKFPTDLIPTLKTWLKLSPNPKYLFIKQEDHTPITSNDITQLLTKIFVKHLGKKVSTSMLRHIRISEDFPAEEDKKRQDLADLMGHSVEMQKDYSLEK